MKECQNISEMVKNIQKIKSISKKQAETITYFLLENKTIVPKIIETLKELQTIKKCSKCNNYINGQNCSICSDKNRQNILVVVEKAIDINKFEQLQPQTYHFFILEALINSKNSQNDKINQNLDKLSTLIPTFDEIILAFSANLDGLVTANVIKNKFKNCKITQLAQGISIGSAMEYVDQLTLKLSLKNRRKVT